MASSLPSVFLPLKIGFHNYLRRLIIVRPNKPNAKIPFLHNTSTSKPLAFEQAKVKAQVSCRSTTLTPASRRTTFRQIIDTIFLTKILTFHLVDRVATTTIINTFPSHTVKVSCPHIIIKATSNNNFIIIQILRPDCWQWSGAHHPPNQCPRRHLQM